MKFIVLVLALSLFQFEAMASRTTVIQEIIDYLTFSGARQSHNVVDFAAEALKFRSGPVAEIQMAINRSTNPLVSDSYIFRMGYDSRRAITEFISITDLEANSVSLNFYCRSVVSCENLAHLFNLEFLSRRIPARLINRSAIESIIHKSQRFIGLRFDISELDLMTKDEVERLFDVLSDKLSKVKNSETALLEVF